LLAQIAGLNLASHAIRPKKDIKKSSQVMRLASSLPAVPMVLSCKHVWFDLVFRVLAPALLAGHKISKMISMQ
jgi:hypothetical protein